MDYFFEERQDLDFLLYDIDDPRAGLDKQDFLGSFKVSAHILLFRHTLF